MWDMSQNIYCKWYFAKTILHHSVFSYTKVIIWGFRNEEHSFRSKTCHNTFTLSQACCKWSLCSKCFVTCLTLIRIVSTTQNEICIRQIKQSCKYCKCNYAQTFCVDCFTPSQNWKLHAWITFHTIQLSTVFVTIHLNPITKPFTKKYLFDPRWQQFWSNNKNTSNFFKCGWIFNFENSAGSYSI